jgi:hypothetical protein
VIPSDGKGKRKLRQVKADFSGAVGGASDHLILVRLFNDWSLLPNGSQQYRFAAENCLSHPTLVMIKGMREQLEKDLCARGLLKRSPTGQFHQSKRAQNQTVVRCVLVRPLAGLLSEITHTRKLVYSVEVSSVPVECKATFFLEYSSCHTTN